MAQRTKRSQNVVHTGGGVGALAGAGDAGDKKDQGLAASVMDTDIVVPGVGAPAEAPADDSTKDNSSDVKNWSVDEVVRWAKQAAGLDDEDLSGLRKHKVKGKHLEGFTAKKLVEVYGLAGGPAEDLVAAIDTLLGRSTGGAGGQGAEEIVLRVLDQLRLADVVVKSMDENKNNNICPSASRKRKMSSAGQIVSRSVVVEGIVADTGSPLIGHDFGNLKVKSVFRSAGYQCTCLVEDKSGKVFVFKCDPKMEVLRLEYEMCQRMSDVRSVVRVTDWVTVSRPSETCSQVSIRCGGIVMKYHKGVCGYLPWAPIGAVARHSQSHFFSFFKQLLEVLIALKTRRIVHTDICPRNIVYDESTSTLTLLDFGNAIEEDGVDHVKRSLLWSTPFNSAPETEGNSNSTIRSYTDVWAVGVMYLMAILHLRQPPHPHQIKRLLREHASNPCMDAALVMLHPRKHSRCPQIALSRLKEWYARQK